MHHRTLTSIATASLVVASMLCAADWPTYRGDAARSGSSPERLPSPLALAWTYRIRHAPRPAWRVADTRMPFDHACEPVVAGDTVYFGSSADCKVYALDAGTGEERWAMFTGGPIRCAPAVWQDRLFVASDDGVLYCLSAADGSILWKHRGGPGESMVLGNDRIISRWPARGGPVVAEATVYYAAGIWPSEGVTICAIDAATGKPAWINGRDGARRLPQPHPGAEAASGVSAQGHLVVAGNLLLLPTGRAVPAAFNRADGSFRYFHLQRYGQTGGSEIAAADPTMFSNGGNLFDAATGILLHQGLGSTTVAVTPDAIVCARPDAIVAFDRRNLWKEEETVDRKGKATRRRLLREPAWRMANPLKATHAMIVAGADVILGGDGAIAVLETPSGKSTMAAAVEGKARGLAAAGGRLFASTDRGVIYCFAGAPSGAPRVHEPGKAPAPPPSPAALAAADEIIRKTGVTDGYVADLGCGDGELAYALALRSDLCLYGIDPDPRTVARARARLDAAGLYGVRVTVHEGDPARVEYPRHFANLVISGRSLEAGAGAVPDEAVSRVLRPYGGIACLGPAGSMTVRTAGPLPGAGAWTHQYADAANTGCSADRILRGPLRARWFRDPDFEVPNRHGRGPAPLFLDGRLFVEGIGAIRCIDAYNGRTLWEHPLPGVLAPYDQDHLMGTAGTGSNLCVIPGGLYVNTGDRCLRIDPAAGTLLGTFEPPRMADGKAGVWGAIACDGGILFGTIADTKHIVSWRFKAGDMSRQFTESALLFALDAKDGSPRWRYKPEKRIRHNAIAFGGDRVFLIDREPAAIDRLDRAKKKDTEPTPPAHQPGTLVALSQVDGSTVWKRDGDIFGTMLILGVAHDVLLMAYQNTAFKLDSEVGGRLAAFRASTGEPLWDVRARYGSRPIVQDRTIYAQPGAWDLLTGKEIEGFSFGRSYGCGTIACSSRLLVYRSATLGYTDLARGAATENYGGIRPGCWINAIPAGGIVLMPDAARKCVCSYLTSATIALEPDEPEAETPGAGR